MASFSSLRELGNTYSPSLDISFSTFLLDLGPISRLRPHNNTQNLLHHYSMPKRPARAEDSAIRPKCDTLDPSRATFPPHDIDFSGLQGRTSQLGDVFLWMTNAGDKPIIHRCWVLENCRTVAVPPKQFMRWVGVNVRRPCTKHPSDNTFNLVLDPSGPIGWEPVQYFAANSLVCDSIPPPDFENLGKLYDPELGPLHVFLIRHEDSLETNLCYISPNSERFPYSPDFDPVNFQRLATPSMRTKAGDVFIKLSSSKFTSDILIDHDYWILSEGDTWTTIKKTRGDIRHPIYDDYVFDAELQHPRWCVEPLAKRIEVRGKPADDRRSTRSVESRESLESNTPTCGQRRPAHDDGSSLQDSTDAHRIKRRRVPEADHLQSDTTIHGLDGTNGDGPQHKTSENSRAQPDAERMTMSPDTTETHVQDIELSSSDITISLDMGAANTEIQAVAIQLPQDASDAFQPQLASLETVQSESQAKLRAANEAISDLQNILDESHRTQVVSWTRYDAKIDELKNEISFLTDSLHKATKTAEQADDQTMKEKTLRIESERRAQSLHAELDRSQTQYSDQQGALAEALRNRELSDSKAEHLQSSIDSILESGKEKERAAWERIVNLESELQKAKKETESLGKEVQEFRLRTDSLRDAISKNEDSLKMADDERDRLRAEIDSIIHERKETQAGLAKEAAKSEKVESFLKSAIREMRACVVSPSHPVSSMQTCSDGEESGVTSNAIPAPEIVDHHDCVPHGVDFLGEQLSSSIAELQSQKARAAETLSSTEDLLNQERQSFAERLGRLHIEIRDMQAKCEAEIVKRESSESALAEIRRECREPFVIPILLDLFLQMRECGNDAIGRMSSEAKTKNQSP